MIEVPAGTKVLLSLHSGVNTKTAQPGDGVYLSSNFPVVADGHVVSPSGVYVQGVIDTVVRPGHVKGRAQVTMHFTTMIFPNGSVVSIPGTVNSLPGSAGPTVKGSEGTIEQAGSKGKDVGAIATGAATGAGLGGIIGAASDHPGAGVGYGALGGAVGGVLYTLFTRGNEIMLEQGSTIEMVLQRPLMLEEANLTAANAPGFVPTGQQQQPMPKPVAHPRILCPLGTLGCQ
jgi:type IV secretion system protein VirB10